MFWYDLQAFCLLLVLYIVFYKEELGVPNRYIQHFGCDFSFINCKGIIILLVWSVSSGEKKSNNRSPLVLDKLVNDYLIFFFLLFLFFQTAMDQLHMHFTQAIHNTVFQVVLGYVELCAGNTDTKFQKLQYKDLCTVCNSCINMYFLISNSPLL